MGMNVEQELAQGIALHNAGELGEAARCYQRVLADDPGNVDALNLMSALATFGGEPVIGADLAAQAIAGDPEFFAPYVNLGNALQALGQFEEAAAAFHKATELNGESAEAFSNLANALNACGRHEEANDAAVQAIALNPEMVEAVNNFGNALRGLGSPEEAIECYIKCTEINPDYADAWQNLGNTQLSLGDAENALSAFVHALQIEETAPRFFGLGCGFMAVLRYEEAVGCFVRSIEMDPTHVDAWLNLSTVLKYLGRMAEAEAVQRDALSVAPDDADAHFNLAVLLLQQGKYEEGWREYEWRWRREDFAPLLRDFAQPRWEGGRFDGKTLLVTCEQGFGDALEFSRFIPFAAAHGGRVVVECRPGLERLLSTVAGCSAVVVLGDDLPDFDLHIPLMSLPGVLGVTLENLPARTPYLSVPPGVADFSGIIRGDGVKVGIAWAGKASRDDNALRSCQLNDLTPLLDMDGITFYSLQVGADAGLGGQAHRSNLIDLAPYIKDFADTAAAVSQLDLVITVDTSVAHVAGALGKPVWVLLSRPTNAFLWMDERVDSPWYSSVQLFRQTEFGDWNSVVRMAATSLADGQIQKNARR